MIQDSFKSRYKTVPVAISENKTCFPTRPHNHNEIEIVLVCQGKTEVRINGKCFQAQTGDLVFVSPLEVHSLVADHGHPYYHRCICFDTSLIGNRELEEVLHSGELRLPQYVPQHHLHNRYLVQKFEELYETVEQDGALMAMEIPAYTALLFAYILKNDLLTKNSGRDKNSIFCSRVHRYITENYQLPITSNEAAEAMSFNQSYFCRVFRKNFNMTFSDYLNFYRVSASKKLMEEGKKTISYIASACGFDNVEYFSRCFKKYLGVSPRDYKKSTQYGKKVNRVQYRK